MPTTTLPVMVLIDDDAAVLSALTFAFETDGFAVAGFLSAEAFLAAAPPACACLVLDQRLPGMSGLELIERLRAGGETAPAILITTNPSSAVRARALANGVAILEKPLLGDAVTREVRRLIGA